jgi:hypothetical protein
VTVEIKLLRENVKHFAIFGERDAAGGFDGAANVVALNIARPRGNGDSSTAVDAAHVAAGNANTGRLDRNANDAFGFFDGAADRADREIEIDDLAFAPAFGFGGAERGEFHGAVFVLLADERTGLGAADIERYNVAFLLGQALAPYYVIMPSALIPSPFCVDPR